MTLKRKRVMWSRVLHRLMVSGAVAAAGMAISPAWAQNFVETFDDGAAATRFTTGMIGNPSINYAYDYSTYGIPPAPGSGGTTIGLRMAARTTLSDPAGAVAATRNGTPISGDYVMTADMWINYNGGAGGGPGSTEMAFWGLNNTGSGVMAKTFAGATADGYAFTATGEGGASADYQVYYTDPSDDGPSFPKANAVWAAGGNAVDGAGNEPDNHFHDYYDDPTTGIFPSPTFETAGAPGKQWVAIRIEQTGNTVSTFMNGFLISTLTLADAADGQGHIYLSYADIFTGSVPGVLEDCFVIFDNVRVVPEPGALALGLLGLGVLARRRRRVTV